MIRSIPINRELLGRSRLLRGGMWLFLFLLLLSLYGHWLIAATPEPLNLAWRIIGPFYLLTDFLNPVYVDRSWFFSLCVGGLIVCGLFWVAGRKGWRVRAVLGALVSFILAAPLFVTQMYDPYVLRSVSAAPVYELNWLTQPVGVFASAFKSAQREHDVVGCKYRLHGWSGDQRLYYGSDCRNDLWMYDPQSGGKPRRIKRLPVDSGISSTVITAHFRPTGKGGLWVSKVVEESPSADSMNTAYVIQDSFYGPYDVVVLSRTNSE